MDPTAMRQRLDYTVDGSTVSSSYDIYKHVDILANDTYQGFRLLGGPRAGETTYSADTGESEFQSIMRKISRDLPEKMAYQAREDGVFVFTLGLGDALLDDMGNGTGEDMLYRMANDPRMQSRDATADEFEPNQKQGVYCFAEDESDLGPCFDKMLDVIIRLTL